MSELDAVREAYERGELRPIEEDLEAFLRANRREILRFREEHNRRNPGRPIDEVVAFKLFVLRTRSINPRREILEQIAEIEKARAGQARDPHEAAVEWARLHSPAWRSYRVTAIIYVFERNLPRYLPLLQ